MTRNHLVQQLLFRLRWQAAIDLDLMAFYRTHSGVTGSVYSDHYIGGQLGQLTEFPFIALNHDDGINAQQGDHEEVLRITRMEDMAEIVVCAVNFSHAIAQPTTMPFQQYDGCVEIMDDTGLTTAVPLNMTDSGEAVLIARVLHMPDTGAQLQMENRIIRLADLYRLPGAQQLQLSEKIALEHSGDSYQLTWADTPNDLCLNLTWQPHRQGQSRRLVDRLLNNPDQTADLDLGCFYQRTDGTQGVIQALGGAFGAFDAPPYMVHSGDDRTGQAEGETILINGHYLTQMTRLLVYAYIYQGVANWSQANSVFTLRQRGGLELMIKLDEHRPACAFCAVAEIHVHANSLQITRDLRFFASLHELSAAYQWELEWLPGHKE